MDTLNRIIKKHKKDLRKKSRQHEHKLVISFAYYIMFILIYIFSRKFMWKLLSRWPITIIKKKLFPSNKVRNGMEYFILFMVDTLVILLLHIKVNCDFSELHQILVQIDMVCLNLVFRLFSIQFIGINVSFIWFYWLF